MEHPMAIESPLGAKSLQAAEERLRLLMENINDHAILMLDKQGHLVDWNLGAERILGYQEEEIVGKNFSIFFTPEDTARGIPQMELQVAETRGKAVDERWHLRKDGSLFWASGVVEPLRNEDGTLRGFAKILRDFTRRKLAEDELAQSNKDLEDFAYIVSHDLQSPLNKINSFLELLKRDLGPSISNKSHEYMDRIQNSAQRMRDLISSLLQYSKVTLNEKTFEPVDMNHVVDETLSELEVPIKKSKAKITRDDLPTVYARPLQMHQILLNLIDNAIKYRGKEQLSILIKARREGDYWVFSVQDNGVGIEPGYLERIFNLFQRGQDQDQPGTGIGLTICEKIIERHGGRIWVESELGKGSTFYFTLRADRRLAVRPDGDIPSSLTFERDG